MPNTNNNSHGILFALSALFIWGLFPFYFKQLDQYQPFEIIAHRIIWTCLFCGILLIIQRKFAWIAKIKQNPKMLGYILVSSALITANWTTYVWAVNNDQIVEASLGYFITPLFGVLMAVIVFKEKLRTLQLAAILFALTSVILQLVILGKLPIVSIMLAVTFSCYGTLHKKMPILPLPSLFLESLLITPFVIAWLMMNDVASSSISLWVSHDVWLLMLAGPVTLIPLLLYNIATKKVEFAQLSFLGYTSPTMLFLIAVFYYKEAFSMTKLGLFALIWVGLVLFSIDLWNNRPSKARKALSKS